MIVFDRKEKEIKVPEGLGNINLTILNANLEDKTVEINEVETTILPSSGYNGMSSLQIDAQPVYDNGYNEGETAQKDKLTGITITENGTYSREDGYNEVVVDVPDLNGDYNEGYDAGKVDGYNSGYTAGIEYASENAGEIAAANAIDLVATEFGTYYTKYSDNSNIVYPDLVTGIYPNGENFYNYANLTNRVYNTGIIPTIDSKIEFWYKYTNAQSSTYGWMMLIGSGKEEDSTNNYLLMRESDTDTIWFNWGNNKVFTSFAYGEWNHIIISYLDGLVVNGVKLSNVRSPQNDGNSPFYINGIEYSLSNNLNGFFGMIKITTNGVENIIIPTENGFKNITTDEMLEVVKDGDYSFVNNAPIILDNLIKSVDVQPKIDVAKYGIKIAYSTFAEVPEIFDFSNVTNMGSMFQSCGSLQTIPLIDTSNVTNMGSMFQSCGSLQTIPLIDTSNVTNMGSMFYLCSSLRTIPLIDTSNVTDMSNMFSDDNIETLPELDTRNVTSMNGFLRKYGGMQNLTSLPKFNVPKLGNIGTYFYYSQVTLNNLTEVGGWENLNCNWNDNGGLVCLPNLTYQSCINILNGLADVTELGSRTLKVHPNFLTTVGDEISIGINKGWNITA